MPKHYAPTTYDNTQLGQYLAHLEPNHVIWKCPNCTWYRMRRNTETWEKTVIYHPVYGKINNYDAFAKDVNRHDCQATREARIRHGIDPDEINIPYRQRGAAEG